MVTQGKMKVALILMGTNQFCACSLLFYRSRYYIKDNKMQFFVEIFRESFLGNRRTVWTEIGERLQRLLGKKQFKIMSISQYLLERLVQLGMSAIIFLTRS